MSPRVLSSKQFYHVTPAYNLESILASGLDPYATPNEWSNGPKKGGKVYLSPSDEHSEEWGTQIELTHGDTTKMSLLKVDASGLRTRRRKTDIGLHEYTVGEHIDPSRISHVKDFFPKS